MKTTLLAVLGACALTSAVSAADPESTKEIMKLAHKGETSMVKKVTEGSGTDTDFKQLIAYYKFMQKQEPPRGTTESWQAKTAALVKASEGLARKEAGSLESFKKAVNCKACHSEHKPE